MKRLALLLALLATVVSSPAIVISNFYTGFVNGTVIPDNNFSGWADTRNINEEGSDSLTIVNVSVGLNISGGWNGDLYGYLTHSSGTVVLLDRVGQQVGNPAGYANSGFSVILDDLNGTSSIQGTGSYSSTAALSGTLTSKDGTLDTAFAPTTINGNWTLFLADLSSGDVSTVQSWSLTITAVPEPTTWAALIFGSVFGAVQFLRFRRRKV